MLIDGQERGARIHPRTGIVILDAILHDRKRRVRMPAEYAIATATARVLDRAVGNFVGKPQPARAHAVKKSREAFRLRIELLYLIKQLLEGAADEQVLAKEAVELVAVHGQVALAFIFPDVALINRHAD